MADKTQLRKLTQGVKSWHVWRDKNDDIRPNLGGAILTGMNLSGADLGGADLCGAHLDGANLSSARLSGACLRGADLRYANLDKASLRRADLRGATLRSAMLNKTDFSDAILAFTDFGNVDLSGVVGLETVTHSGPSTIGVDTVHLSKGKIPEVFLRGAGTPDSFISYMVSLAGRASDFHSCFISYSSKDQAFAERLHTDLQDNGVRCWFAPEDVKGGEKLYEQIVDAIPRYDKLLLVLSEHSIKSEWVMTEIRKTREAEKKEQRRKLFPIRLVDFDTLRDWTCFDADTGKDLAVEVREYFIPDFSNWKDHDAFESAFDRLLKDLKAKDEPKHTSTE